MTDAEAVDALVALGLRQYEAKCFVALTQLAEGTAKEISRVSDVPQSRVYDVLDQLHRLGLVDIQESEPRRYAAVSVDTARTRLRQQYRTHLETATETLQKLERRTIGDDGVWTVASGQDVSNRTTSAVEHATSELYVLVADRELLDSVLLERLAEARERGVTVFVEVPSSADRSRIHDTVPAAKVAVADFESDSQTGSDRSLGRLLLADRETVVLSALTEGLIPSETTETGLWASERGHGLVHWFRYVLECRLARCEFDTGTTGKPDDSAVRCERCEE